MTGDGSRLTGYLEKPGSVDRSFKNFQITTDGTQDRQENNRGPRIPIC